MLDLEDYEVPTHRAVVWSLPESIRADFLNMADEIAHHRRVVDAMIADPGVLWHLPIHDGQPSAAGS